MEELGSMGLVSLLRTTWIIITLPIVIALVPLPGFRWLHTTLSQISQRGKILESNSKLTVPQRFFSHYYAVAILWTTILLFALSSYATGGGSHEYINVRLPVFLLVLMELHLLRRLYESIFVFNYSPSARMHVSTYLLGILFYIMGPLSLCCNLAPQVFDVKENDHIVMPGFNNIWMFVTPFLRLPWYAWIGAVIFFWGWVHQLRCHQILGSLRDKSEKMKDQYVIPYGDWFEYVSSPHYTAEIVIYGGLVVASGGVDLSLWLLFAFVVANLVFTAKETQGWYRRKFEDYPRNRYIIFPFVY